MMYGYGGFWIIIGLIALFLFLVLIVALIIVGVSVGRNRDRGMPTEQRSAGGGEDALNILRQRYARGEISREEYQSMREDLSQ
jgi:putative membrane protein